jgi:hypothetical protein
LCGALVIIVLSYPAYPLITNVWCMLGRWNRWVDAGYTEAAFDARTSYAALLIHRTARRYRPWLNRWDALMNLPGWRRHMAFGVFILLRPLWLDMFERCVDRAVDREISRLRSRSKRK